MKSLLDNIALYLGYIVLFAVILFAFLVLYVKIQDILDNISYKIWLRKRGKESEDK